MELEQENGSQELSRGLVRTVALVMTVAAVTFLVVDFLLIWIMGGLTPVIMDTDALAGTIFFSIAFLMIRKNNSPRRTSQAIYLILTGLAITVAVAQYLVSAGSAIPAGFITLPVLAGILGLSKSGVIAVTVASVGLTAIFYSAEKIFNLYTPLLDVSKYPFINLLVWVVFVGIVATGVAVFAHRLNKSQLLTTEQNKKLKELIAALNSTTAAGASLSRELSGVTAELSATSRQQAAGSQEQVAALSQVTSSLEELNESATQIALSSEAATGAALEMVNLATVVKDTSELAEATSQEGGKAVQQAIESVERVSNRIELLAQRLLELTKQNSRVEVILNLINDIADETHLLSLNASIEAAGGTNAAAPGHTGGGERFGVIAQEINNLASRSREATQQVQETIREMQGAVAAAVLAAEEGKKETFTATSRSYMAGSVIQKLKEVIAESAKRAEQILLGTEEVQIRCNEIRLATVQQRTANQQILATMRDIAQISRESAGAVTQLSSTVNRVDNRVVELNQVLAKSNDLVASNT